VGYIVLNDAVTYIATGSGKAAKGAGLFMGIGGLRGGKIGADIGFND
jgi:hypothetical protein